MANYILGPDWNGYNTSFWNAGQSPQPQSGFNWGAGFDPAQLAAIGFTGDPYSFDNSFSGADSQPGPVGTGTMTGYSDALRQYLASKGITSRIGSGPSGYASALFGPDGKQIGPTKTWGEGSDDAFGLAFLLGSAGAGAAAAGAGGAAAGGGAASSGSTGALGAGAGYIAPSVPASLAGMTDAQLAAYGASLGGAGGAAAGAAGGSALSGGGAAGGGATAGGVGAGGTAAGGGLLSSVGDLAGSKAGGALLGAGLGLLGDKTGLNSATTSAQNIIDPRIAQYLYGADGKSGLAAATNQLMTQQMTDPAIAQGYGQMRSVGSGLLSQPIAGNPFTTGQAVLPQNKMRMQPVAQGLLSK